MEEAGLQRWGASGCARGCELWGGGGRPCRESLSIRGARGRAVLRPRPRACGMLLCVWLFFSWWKELITFMDT